MRNEFTIKEYSPSDNQAALELEERCPQGEELKISFHRKLFHQRSEMYKEHVILTGFYNRKLVAVVAGAVKEILVDKKKVKAGHFYDLRVDPEFRKLKLRIAQKMCREVVSRISPKTDLIYCLIAGRNMRALHLVKRDFNPQAIIPFKYVVNPVYKQRGVKSILKDSGYEEVHKNFLKYYPDLDFYCLPDFDRLFGYVRSYGIDSDRGEAGCSIWSSKDILGERVENVPKKFKRLRILLRIISLFMKTPQVPRKGETLDSWYVFDFYASNEESAKELFFHVNNEALKERKSYVYLPLQETHEFYLALNRCCWKFSPVIDYFILARGKFLPKEKTQIYLDIRDL